MKCNQERAVKIRKYIKTLSKQQLIKLAYIMAYRLVECEEIGFREHDELADIHEECLYWDGSGEDLLSEEECS